MSDINYHVSDDEFMSSAMGLFNPPQQMPEVQQPTPVVPEVPEEQVLQEAVDLEPQEQVLQESYDIPVTEEDLNYLLQPVELGGTSIELRGVEEARQLMELGTKYQQEVASVDTQLRLSKVMEMNNLTSDDLNYLIDLKNGDVGAIQKLLKDTSYDQYGAEEVEYVPKDYGMDDETYAVVRTLESIKNTPSYSKTVDVISNKWDKSSRATLSSKPEIIRQLNTQMGNGIYDLINAEVSRYRMFGGLAGLSDFDAYYQVGAQMYKDGKLQNHVHKQVTPTSVPKVPVPSQQTVQTNNRRRAAMPPTTAAQPVQQASRKTDYSVLSDEEFMNKYKHLI